MDGTTGSMTTTLVTFALIILIFYFLIIRPQKKRDKEAKAMIEAMKKGDKVVTIGGIHGTIVMVKDKTVIVKVDDSARIEFSKTAISSVTSKGSEKAAPKKEKEAIENKKGEAGSIGIDESVPGSDADELKESASDAENKDGSEN